MVNEQLLEKDRVTVETSGSGPSPRGPGEKRYLADFHLNSTSHIKGLPLVPECRECEMVRLDTEDSSKCNMQRLQFSQFSCCEACECWVK